MPSPSLPSSHVTETRFTTDDHVSLEGDLRVPDDAVAAAVICHAHPRHGGSKDHPILWALRTELTARRFCVLGFNFRGVMGSGGTYGGGRTETRDLRAAIDRVRRETDRPILVCGWSFGANVALREAVADERVAALALIGLPLEADDVEIPGVPGRSELRAFRRAVLLVAGEGDVYAPRGRLEALATQLPSAKVAILPGTDHFLWRREKETAGVVGTFAARAFGLDQVPSSDR
jgi:alpha/beta superfamily hydrolase